MDDPTGTTTRTTAPTPPAGAAPKTQRRHKVKGEQLEDRKGDQFCGYEELLDIDDDQFWEDMPTPTGRGRLGLEILLIENTVNPLYLAFPYI